MTWFIWFMNWTEWFISNQSSIQFSNLYLVKNLVFGQTIHLKLSVMGESEFGWNLKALQPQPHQEFTLESTCCLNQYFKWCLESQAQYQTYPKGIHLTKSCLWEWKMTFLTHWKLRIYIYDGKDCILICDDVYSSTVQCHFSACSEIQWDDCCNPSSLMTSAALLRVFFKHLWKYTFCEILKLYPITLTVQWCIRNRWGRFWFQEHVRKTLTIRFTVSHRFWDHCGCAAEALVRNDWV